MNERQLYARNIQKSYPQGASQLHILKSLDFELYRGDAVSIVGLSGAGKSTLLQILGTLDQPDAGDLYYKESNLLKMTDKEMARFRSDKLGFVFQFHHLLSEFSALENVMMPLQIAGESTKAASARAHDLLNLVGLSERSTHYPSQLSGGELQRVAIARALAREPEIILADEPTGNLDSKTSRTIQDLFFELQETLKVSLVVVTHDRAFAERFPRQLVMNDGLWLDATTSDQKAPSETPVRTSSKKWFEPS